MGREVKRVPVDFDHPLNEVWSGFLMPEELRLPTCPDCGGRGVTAAHEAERLEAMQPSPVIRAMRATVDAERTWRRHLERLGGRG